MLDFSFQLVTIAPTHFLISSMFQDTSRTACGLRMAFAFQVISLSSLGPLDRLTKNSFPRVEDFHLSVGFNGFESSTNRKLHQQGPLMHAA